MTTRKLGSWAPGTGRAKRELFTTAIALALIASIALPATAAADESYFRLKDIEIQYLNLWEEPAIASNYGESPHTAKVWVEVEVKQPKKLKVGIYDQVYNIWLKTVVVSLSSTGTYTWQTTINVPLAEQSLGVYAYYWNQSTGAYVQDDAAYGWTPVHSQANVGGPIGHWGPNQYGLPTNSRSGEWATFQQYLWYWDNSFYTSQDVGTDHRARLVWWANRSSAWLWTIEFRRLNGVIGDGSGLGQNKEGWDFAYVICNIGCSAAGYYSWSTDLEGLRVGDTEEKALGGDEEAQFELDNEDIAQNFKVVVAQEPEVRYGNMNYVRLAFYRKPGYTGGSVHVLTALNLQDFCCLQQPFIYSADYLSYIRTYF